MFGTRIAKDGDIAYIRRHGFSCVLFVLLHFCCGTTCYTPRALLVVLTGPRIGSTPSVSLLDWIGSHVNNNAIVYHDIFGPFRECRCQAEGWSLTAIPCDQLCTTMAADGYRSEVVKHCLHGAASDATTLKWRGYTRTSWTTAWSQCWRRHSSSTSSPGGCCV